MQEMLNHIIMIAIAMICEFNVVIFVSPKVIFQYIRAYHLQRRIAGLYQFFILYRTFNNENRLRKGIIYLQRCAGRFKAIDSTIEEFSTKMLS